MLKILQRLYRQRLLIEVLLGRELKTRYRGTVLGFLWSFLNPVLMIVIYSIIFRWGLRAPGAHYTSYLVVGLLPWLAFHQGLSDGTQALIHHGALIKKVYLPVEVFPYVAVITHFIHFLFSIPIVVVFLLVGGIPLHGSLLILPILLLLQLVFTCGLALLLSSLAMQFRDIVHILSNLMSVWFYLTPILYRAETLPKKIYWLIQCNPMAWLIESYHAVLCVGLMPPTLKLAGIVVGSLATWLLGTWIFEWRRPQVAEWV